MKNPKTVLVTGIAGFIGSNFVKQYQKEYPDAEIVGIDDFSTGRKDAVNSNIIFYEGSVADLILLEKIFSMHKPEYIFHFAAYPMVSYTVEHPTITTTANITGTVALLEKARDYKSKRFVLSSSCAVYGNTKTLPVSEVKNHPAPLSPYGLQKQVDEMFCKLFSDLFDIDTVCLRYFNVYGPGQYGGSAYATVICNWLENLFINTSKKPYIEGDGTQSRDFCYVEDVVNANILAMEKDRVFNGEIFNIGSSQRISLIEIKNLIEKHSQKKLELENRPPRLGDVKDIYADISKAKEQLGYIPKTSFEKGLQETINWFKTRTK
ncbi:MAG: hypothetical protein COU07_01245 [Candidatus Harrisonbacteria bacterium CG10_big_fil_rev_8_21_14_0_10_40_38]|uniref:NAD(P)-binding domain-containing protein n=1 Tax=Candidatus Harrisonbacteria bacterium CG10_big_fil_rev_8_21_14_0_10_40_38 TaxID=1974583 RepID=A0A2H0USX2_9BACT|nr:MAG: hypothetical protein COU07_01245 [Candidatus Harrisonbacteria bacterium CG10_big_fil_rev_8_21_14_0_10_40_38]